MELTIVPIALAFTLGFISAAGLFTMILLNKQQEMKEQLDRVNENVVKFIEGGQDEGTEK